MVLSATEALPGWPGTDLRGELGARLGAAVLGKEHVLLVTAGTGVGGSLLLGGKVHRGANATAGHVGHVPVPAARGWPCACGGAGHAEAVAGGPAMLAEYRRRKHWPAVHSRWSSAARSPIPPRSPAGFPPRFRRFESGPGAGRGLPRRQLQVNTSVTYRPCSRCISVIQTSACSWVAPVASW